MSVYDTMVAGLSGAGLVLVGFVTSHGTSEYHLNAFQMEAVLTTNAAGALSQAGYDWASVTLDGQTATLTGAAPDQVAIDRAAQMVLESSGKGGMIYGGVLEVDVRAEIAPSEPDVPTSRPDTTSLDNTVTESEETDAEIEGENPEGSE